MNKQLTVAIIIGSLIIGGGLIISQAMKQGSIERQAQAELADKQWQRSIEEAQKIANEVDLENCIDDADSAYWSYMRINGTEKEDGEIWALNEYWDRAEKNKQTAINNCYKQYK